MAQRFGAEIINLGIIPDRLKARSAPSSGQPRTPPEAGGVSVGDHDYVQEALKNVVSASISGRSQCARENLSCMAAKGQHVLGLPGNPVSALVCARLFLKPLVELMVWREPVHA